jgi:hypothetical protein
MNKKEPQFIDRLTHLFVLSMEGTIDQDQFKIMTNIIRTNPVAREYYYDFIMSYIGLDRMGILSEQNNEDQENLPSQQMWNELLKFEETAPVLEIPAVSMKSQESGKSSGVQERRPPVSKLSVYFLLLSSAALIFVIVYAFLFSMGRGVEVATLTDSMNAKWADIAFPMEKGVRIATGNDRWLLREGYAELRFDNQASVTLEGPVEFQILAEDRIGLNYGKVYVRVSKEAAGFSVYTQNAKIIDLGTEFGVQVEIGGNTQLHVFKGKTMVMAGKSNRVNLEINQGDAKKISGKNGEISDIRYQSDYFVRNINSELKSIWRGQELDLADMVGGGNGLGIGKQGSCIDTSTGEWKSQSYLPAAADIKESAAKLITNNCFNIVKGNPFIDGVFIPDNRQGPVILSSQGHSFSEFPDTSGLGWGGIVYIEETLLKRPIKLNGVRYGVPGKSALFMHGNAGITFDLKKIREVFPGSLKEFRAVYGIADDYWMGVGCPAYADFWVLVDGQVRFSRKGVQVHQGGSITVALSDSDRFLTLVTTDGGKGSPEYDNRTSFNDWSVFAEPCLIVE